MCYEPGFTELIRTPELASSIAIPIFLPIRLKFTNWRKKIKNINDEAIKMDEKKNSN